MDHGIPGSSGMKHREVQFHNFLIETIREEIDFVLVGRGLLPTPSRNQAVSAPVLRRNTTSRRDEGLWRNPNRAARPEANTVTL